jgi:hypothetical protein
MSDELEVAPEIEVSEVEAQLEAVVEPVVEPVVAPVEPPKRKLKKIIQVNDKEGKPLGQPMTFYYTDAEDFATQLTESVAHGTRRIHELSRKATLEPQKVPDGAEIEAEAPVYKPRELTEDEKFVVKTDPEKAFDVLYQAKFGVTPQQAVERERTRDQAAKIAVERAESELFNVDHPEFLGTPDNRTAMIDYMQKYKLTWSRKNLDIAYKELSASGLLETPPPPPEPEEVVPDPPAPAPPIEAPRRAATPDFPAVIRNNSSRATAPIKVKDGKPTAEQIANMSADEWAQMYPELRQAR